MRTRSITRAIRVVARVSHLPRHIAEREAEVVRRELGGRAPSFDVAIETVDSPGPGNVVTIEIESRHVTEVFTGIGQRGVRAETVAKRVAREARSYLESSAPVGPHLADQLLIPFALAAGGAFRTVEPTLHARTNAAVIERFLPVEIDLRPDEGTFIVEVRNREA